MSEQMSGALNVEQIMEQIRERVRLRKEAGNGSAMADSADSARMPSESPAAALSLYNLSMLNHNVVAAGILGNQVGTINPRNPGWHNNLLQLVKKLMQRMLAWYTRPLHQFNNAISSSLKEVARALDNLQANVTALTDWQNNRLGTFEQRLEQNKATEGLWFNEPIILQYDGTGRPSWARTSERIVEKAWVLRHLADLIGGAKILDCGCTESFLSLELASNGFFVTGIDVRPYPLQHPNFDFIQGDITAVPLPSAFFDAIILLSTIEHIGLGWYGDPKGEIMLSNAIKEVHRLLKPGGHLLLTVPFGKPAVAPLHRIFDAQQLRHLLKDFNIEALEYGIKMDERTWRVPASEEEAELRGHDPETYAPGAVALAVCRKSK
jgi:SAM-dependent methyltransferase